jgi:NitT/TauT family transport system substrate-binding protein
MMKKLWIINKAILSKVWIINHRRRFLFALTADLLLILSLGLAACGAGQTGSSGQTGGAGQTAPTPNEELTIALAPAAIGAQPLVIYTENKGYFAEEGLTVHFENVSSGLFEALSAGKIDASMNGITPVLTYGAKGANVTLFAGTASGGVFAISRTDRADELRDPANWAGKTLVTTTLSTSEHVIATGLKAYGIDFNTQITHIEVDTDANIIEVVRKGQADLGFLLPEYGTNINDLDLSILFPTTDLVEDYVCCRQAANSVSLATKRTAFVKFLQAQIRAYKEFLNDQDAVVALLAQRTNQEEDYVRAIVFDPERSANRKTNPDPDLRRTLTFYQSLIERGYLDGETPLSDFFDVSIYEDALNNLLERYPDDDFYKELKVKFEADNKNLSGQYL